MSKGKIALWSILAIILLVGVPMLVWGANTGFRFATAEIKGKVEAREEIQSGAFRIFSYNHFYDMLVDINEFEAQYDAQKDILDSMSGDEETYAQQQSKVAALKVTVERLQRQYNADADKEETIGQFRDNNLPERVEVGHEYGERTGQ